MRCIINDNIFSECETLSVSYHRDRDWVLHVMNKQASKRQRAREKGGDSCRVDSKNKGMSGVGLRISKLRKVYIGY